MQRPQDELATVAGPLTVSAANPRYFTAAAGTADQKAVYLTGSHIWNNLHDGMGPGQTCAEAPELFDYDAYLDFLAEHGHNFIRLWRWEQFRSQAAGGDFHLCMTPQPWPRTGPGAATDGKPRFDLDRFDQAFFDRLRDRVVAAGRRGIYVAVMFFDGWALHLSPAPDHVEGHPFHAANNVNGVGIGSILDYQVLPLDPRVQQLQEAYLRKVVDTVGDLPNLLWEVANESSGGGEVDPAFAELLGQAGTPEWGDSTAWQSWVIDVVKRYEQAQGYDRHPIGMTMQFPVPTQTKVNAPLLASRAEWISPGYDDEVFAGGGHPMAPGSPQSRWLEDPPAADGGKVVISDTDHYAPGRGDALWAWKSFLRGHHPILMDFGIIGGVNPSDPTAGGPMSYAAFEPARWAMGDTRRLADRVSLIDTEPRGELSSTGYALADPGQEYLVLQPSATADPFTVRLDAGTYTVEWFGVDSRQTMEAGQVTAEDDEHLDFTAPWPETEPAVLYLRRTEHRSAVTPETRAATADRDGFVTYDELRGPDLDAARWRPVRLPLPTGGEHVPLDPNAELAVGEGEVRVRIPSFSLAHDTFQSVDSAKYLISSTRQFELPPDRPATFAVDLAVENIGGEPGDYRRAMAAFQVFDLEASQRVFSVCGTSARVLALDEQLGAWGAAEPFIYVVESPYEDFDDDFTRLRACEVTLDRSSSTAAWRVDGRTVYQTHGTFIPERVRIGFGIWTMLPIRDGRSRSLDGQGMTARWRRFRTAV